MRCLGVHTQANISMIADVALVPGPGDRRLERAQLKLRIFVEERNLPRSRRIDRRLAERKELLRVGVLNRFIARRQVGLPRRQRFPGFDIGWIGKLRRTFEQRLTAFLALPIVRADVLKAHSRRFPLLGGAHRQWSVGAILFNLVQRRDKFFLRRGWLQAERIEGILIVDKAMNHRGHRYTEGRLAVVGDPGALCNVAEVLHAFQIGKRREIAIREELERGIERAARNQIARSAALKLGVQCGIVLCWRSRLEGNLDVGMTLFKRWNNRILPDREVVVAPAFDRERNLAAASRRCSRRLIRGGRSGCAGRRAAGSGSRSAAGCQQEQRNKRD